eukprot:9763472-Heterocapsa_arctica.AAC.1
MDDYEERSWYEEQLRSYEKCGRRNHGTEMSDDYEGTSCYMNEENMNIWSEQGSRDAHSMRESN